jgi:hypothetical protein
MQNISSEQELKQLLDEGKLSQQEYQELKQAMAEKNKVQDVKQEEGENRSDSIYNLGKNALLLALGGILIPFLGYLFVELFGGPDSGADIEPWMFLFYGMEIPALVIGSISWNTGFGRAATVTAAILILLSLNFFA